MKVPAMVKKNRKALSWIGGLLVAWVLYAFAITPYRLALTSARTRLASEEAKLKVERNAVATAKLNPMLQQMTDSAVQAVEPKLFSGTDDAIATSDLQAYLHQVAYDNKVNVVQASTRPATELTPGVRALHVDVRAESDYQGILSLLKALAGGDKLVTIERFDIAKAAKGAVGLAAPEDIETVSFNATVTGYAMGDLSTSKTATPTSGAKTAPAPAKTGGKQ